MSGVSAAGSGAISRNLMIGYMLDGAAPDKVDITKS
jgi:hypothetical protein